MSTHPVTAGDRIYLVADDGTPLFRALIAGVVVNEVTGVPLDSSCAVAADRGDVTAKVLEGGLFVVSAFVERLLLPTSVVLTFTAAGYRLATLTVPIAATAIFPIDAGAVSLRPMPVRLQGRVVENTVGRAPIGGAALDTVTPQLFALRTPLLFDHAPGVTVRERPLNPAGGAKTLTADVRSGSSTIFVSSIAGLLPGVLVRLGADLDAEYAVVTGGGPLPKQINLATPLVRSFAAGADVRRRTKGIIGATTTLARSANSGDGLLLLNAPLSAATVEIVDGAATEYNTSGALSDAEGFYQLDGMGGAASLDLRASASGFLDLDQTWSLDYGQPVNVVNFRLST